MTTDEQTFKTHALTEGMKVLNKEFKEQLERRDVEGYQAAVLELLKNVDETWRKKNEESFFDRIEQSS